MNSLDSHALSSLLPIRRLVGLVLVAILGAGCSEGRKKTHPVYGHVFVDGRPAQGAVVTFVPVDRESDPDLIAQGIIRDDGSFAMGTHKAGDGVPVGEYVVAIRWPDHVAGKGVPIKGEPRSDKLRGRYKSTTSEIRVMVVAGVNRLEPFRLLAGKSPK